MATAFPTSDEDIRALRVKILRALGAAKYPAQAIGSVAGNNNLTVEDVKALVANYGWPDPKEMSRHAFELASGPAYAASPPRPAAPRPSAPPPPPAGAIEQLLGTAEKSAKARTRRLVARIRESLIELREIVITEKKEAEAAQAQAEEQVRLKAEVDALEQQLAEKKAQLKKPGTTKARASTTPQGNAKTIRAWAAAHSVACPTHGRVPRDVVEAYETAIGGGA